VCGGLPYYGPVQPSPIRIELNGSAAGGDHVQQLALPNYGHFTAMQVRDGRTRGLDLHLSRLDDASCVMFGSGMDPRQVRGYIRHALADVRDAPVRVIVFWPEADDARAVMVTVRPPGEMPAGPQSRCAPVRRADLPSFAAAFVTNSRGIAPVTRIDTTVIPDSPGLIETVSRIYESVPWAPI
jgi:branched-subunit amino acid aminotransferase/4-amino-4-deoxychorismate lyase